MAEQTNTSQTTPTLEEMTSALQGVDLSNLTFSDVRNAFLGAAQTSAQTLTNPMAAAVTAASPIIASWNIGVSPNEKSFGIEHLSGANTAEEKLAHFIAFSYFEGKADDDHKSDPDTIGHAREQAIRALLSDYEPTGHEADDLAAFENASDQVNILFNAMHQAGKEGMDFSESASESLQAADLDLGEAFEQQLDKAREAEEARRHALVAAMQQAEGEEQGATVSSPKPEKSIGLLNDETKQDTLDGVDKVFNAGAAAGYPAISDRQRTLVKAIFVQEYGSAKNWDNEYAIANGVTSVFAYGGAFIGTGAQALEDAYVAYKEAGGEWTKKEWDETLKTRASAVWDQLGKTIGTDGKEKFQTAYQAVSQRTMEEMAENAGFAINHHPAHVSMRGSDHLHEDTLQFILDEDPELYATLTGDANIPPSEAKVKYRTLTAMIEEPTKLYTTALVLTDQGPKSGQVPARLDMVVNGEGPIAAIPKSAGNVYPVDGLNADGSIRSGSVANRWLANGRFVKGDLGATLANAVDTEEVTPPTVPGDNNPSRERT